MGKKWWLGWDSNPRPRHYECHKPISAAVGGADLGRGKGCCWLRSALGRLRRGSKRAYHVMDSIDSPQPPP